jgi:hypothetical protein
MMEILKLVFVAAALVVIGAFAITFMVDVLRPPRDER